MKKSLIICSALILFAIVGATSFIFGHNYESSYGGKYGDIKVHVHYNDTIVFYGDSHIFWTGHDPYNITEPIDTII